METIPEMMQRLRDTAGLSRADAAHWLGIAWNDLYRIEEGLRTPRPDRLYRLVERYEELLNGRKKRRKGVNNGRH